MRLIENLPRTNTEPFRIGLFELLRGATVGDFSIEGAQIYARNANSVGFVAGSAENSRLENITVRASSLLAELPLVTMNPVAESPHFQGGICGSTTGGEIFNIVVNSDVLIQGHEGVGGIVGRNGENSTIRLSRSSATVTGLTVEVGGIAGRNHGAIVRSYTTGTISGTEFVGGVVGINFGSSIERSFSLATVKGGSYIGGLAGVHIGGLVGNSYSTGDVIFTGGSGFSIGGFVGWMDVQAGAVIENSYSTSLIVLQAAPQDSGSIGAFVGDVWGYDTMGQAVPIKNSYYDADRNPGLSSLLGISRTTDEMKRLSTSLTYQGWDVLSIWSIRRGFYPRLLN